MIQIKTVKSVLNKHKKRDDWFLDDYSVNPYLGCSCNCQYCYIRGSKYGENMDDGIIVKSNVLTVLEKQLQYRVKKNQYGIIALGSGTDAYMHHENNFKMTEGILKLLLKYRFPVFISTKTNGIIRDINLLKQIDKQAILPSDLGNSLKRGVILSISISSMNENIAATLEPGAILPLKRLEVLQQLKKEGFLAGVNAIPTLPFISDTEEELEKLIGSAKQYEADFILVGSLTLFGTTTADSKTLYYKFLERNYPDLIGSYKNLYQSYPFPPKRYQDELARKATTICRKHQIRTSII